MKTLKLMMLVALGGWMIFFVACQQAELVDPVDPEIQLEEDIAIIEDYLADEGYEDYDTLDTEVRVVILEEGDGEPIEYNDIVSYNFAGKFTDGNLFDTSIAQLAYDQDTANATVYYPETIELDENGLAQYDSIDYDTDYLPIYSSSRNYEPFITTHTPGGWFISQGGSIPGFADGTHHVLDRVNIGGRGLILLPSREAYGRSGSGSIAPNTVILFEITPVSTR